MFRANQLEIEIVNESGPQIWLGELSPGGQTLQYLCLGSEVFLAGDPVYRSVEVNLGGMSGHL